MAFTTDLIGVGHRTAQLAGRVDNAPRDAGPKRAVTLEARMLRMEGMRDAAAQRLSAELELRLVGPLV